VKKRRFMPVLVAGVYLLIVLCGALRVPIVPKVPWLGEIVRAFRYGSGTDNSYGFFAPAVSDEMALDFQFASAKGAWTESLDHFFTGESRQRAGSCVDIFAHIDDEEVQHRTLESWARWALAREPQADKVRVCVKHRAMPTMTDSRNGAHPEWQEWAWATFERGSN
jgi:hypothetical protein